MPGRPWLGYFRPHPGSKTPAWMRLFIGAVSGAALSFSYTGFYLGIYSWVCIGALLIALFGARPRVAFACGFLHGICFVVTSVPWIAEVLAVHGGLSPAGGWAVLLLIATVWSTANGAITWVIHRLSLRSITLACIGAPFLWISLEVFRTRLPEISFPWNLLGYPASANIGLVQLTTITGIYGLSFLVAAFNALLAWCAAGTTYPAKRRLTILLGAALLLSMGMLAGPHFVPKAQSNHTARAVQLNFPEVEEYPSNWFGMHGSDLDEIQRLSLASAASHPDLLVWPEAPAPFSYQDVQFAHLASSLATRFGHPFIAGVVEWKPETVSGGETSHTIMAPYNSALMFDAQGRRVFSYDKMHLVPFGEYEPFPLIHRVVSNVSSEVGGFRKGTAYSVGRFSNGYTFGVFICYEAIYPGEIRRFAANGAQLFVNISNDGWFGHSAAAEQHLRMARVRAVENRRWIVRATNSGITASIDPYGRIVRPLPRDVRAAADLPYDFRTDKTLYTRLGDWFAWLCVIVSGILLVLTFRKAM
ncbi:MAG TPA: apolipoprotein N-acyltransferase [Candidatus Acidoferrum sp.]|nr:apolipoprotein N-acyltransferase [Candidatus Acidoferrum sp.]